MYESLNETNVKDFIDNRLKLTQRNRRDMGINQLFQGQGQGQGQQKPS